MAAAITLSLSTLTLLAAMVWGAYLNHRWMQRLAQGSLGMKLNSNTQEHNQ